MADFCRQTPTQPLSLLNGTWDKIRWQRPSLEIKTRRCLTSYRQNTLQFGKINPEPDHRPCQENLLQRGLLSMGHSSLRKRPPAPPWSPPPSWVFTGLFVHSLLSAQQCFSLSQMRFSQRCHQRHQQPVQVQIISGRSFIAGATARCLITPRIQSHTRTKWTE